MLNKSYYLDRLTDVTNMQYMLEDALEKTNLLCSNELEDLDIINYKYDPEEAIEELGLDLELVNQLLEDYVRQMLNTKLIFIDLIDKLQDDKMNNKTLDYTNLRELAHKNLGVARNLRIENARKLLYRIMKNDDLDYIYKCLEALIASAIILKPKCAFNTLTVMKIKNSL